MFLIGYIIFFCALMYFMAIRPQQKEKKKQQEIIWMSCLKQITQEKEFCWSRIMS